MTEPTRIDIDVFGGLVADYAPESGPPHTASDLQNVEVSALRREIRGSYGATKLISAQIAAASVDGIVDHRSTTDGTHHVLALCNGKLYKKGVSSWTEIKDASTNSLGATAGSVLQAQTLQGKTFCCNGSDDPWYYDGTNWATWGHAGPAAQTIGATEHPYLGSQAGSNTTAGWHEVFFTFYNSTSGDESGPSKIMRIESTAANQQIDVHTGYSKDGGGDYPAVPAWADTIRVYMTQADNPCTFYLADEHDYSGGGDTEEVPDVDVADSSLATVWADFGGPPEAPSHVFRWGTDFTRLAVLGSPSHPSWLFWTNPDEPFRFGPDNFAEIGSDDGDRLQTGAQCAAGVILLKRNSTWGLFGETSQTYTIRLQSDKIGCAARYSLVVVGGMAYWMTYDGIYRSNGAGEPQNLSEGKVRTWIESLNWGVPDYIRVVYVPEREQIWWFVPYGAAQATPNKVLILDLRSGDFLIGGHGLYAGAVQMDSGVESTLVGTADGYVLKLDDTLATPGVDWNGGVQTCYWETQWLPTGGKLVKALVEFDTKTGENQLLTVRFQGRDYDDDTSHTVTETVDMTAGRAMLFVPIAKKLVRVRLTNYTSSVGKTFNVRRISLWTLPLRRPDA